MAPTCSVCHPDGNRGPGPDRRVSQHQRTPAAAQHPACRASCAVCSGPVRLMLASTCHSAVAPRRCPGQRTRQWTWCQTDSVASVPNVIVACGIYSRRANAHNRHVCSRLRDGGLDALDRERTAGTRMRDPDPGSAATMQVPRIGSQVRVLLPARLCGGGTVTYGVRLGVNPDDLQLVFSLWRASTSSTHPHRSRRHDCTSVVCVRQASHGGGPAPGRHVLRRIQPRFPDPPRRHRAVATGRGSGCPARAASLTGAADTRHTAVGLLGVQPAQPCPCGVDPRPTRGRGRASDRGFRSLRMACNVSGAAGHEQA